MKRGRKVILAHSRYMTKNSGMSHFIIPGLEFHKKSKVY